VKKTIFYIIALVLLIPVFIFLNRAFRALTFYAELTEKDNTVYRNFQNLSRQLDAAAIFNPVLAVAENIPVADKFFLTDSLTVLQELDRLKLSVSDSTNISIVKKLEPLVIAELPWLLNSSVTDSLLHRRAPSHLASFREIKSLIRQGIQRNRALIEYRKNRLKEEIYSTKKWMIVFITVSGILLIYTTLNLFRQQSIRQNKEKELETVLNRINDSVASVDKKWRYTFLNDAAMSGLPGSKKDILGKVIWDVHPEMKGTVFWDKYHEAMSSNEMTEIEGYIEPMDTWLSVKLYPSEDGLTIFYKDITQGKKAERELSQTLREISDYKFALDESSIVAITDQKGIIRHANSNFCKISKYSEKELIGQDHRIINSGYHPKGFIKDLWITIANGKIWKGELKNKAKDGTIYWVDTTIIPFLNDQGKPYQYVAIRADITERKLAEENLQKSLKEIADYKYALDESSIIAITDQKGIIKYVNDNFCRISKYSREELIGQDHRIINSGYHPGDFIHDLWVTIANGKIWKGELKNKAKDGTIYWVDTTIVPLLDERSKPYQYLAIRADITERKKGEEEIIKLNTELEEKVIKRTEELQSASREMEAFTYSVSHDLRAPLRGIIGFTTILEEDYSSKLDEEAKRITGIIKNNTMKMGHLIDDLLAFSRTGKQELLKTDIDSNEMVNEIIEESTRPGKIDWNIHSLPAVKADRNTIRQVWINLITNAVKYSRNREKARIEIGSHSRKNDTVFYVKDNGVGFDEQYKEKLFKVFQRLHGPEEFEGSGVGLALVEKIVSRHGGNVWAEGKEDEGACYYFSLPA
jgi:PAS domain S-box-containing protein